MDEPFTKEVALAELAKRQANRPEQIDNASLPAGAPMYYYCQSCGALADTMPEDWWKNPPHTHCEACRGLQEMGWLE